MSVREKIAIEICSNLQACVKWEDGLRITDTLLSSFLIVERKELELNKEFLERVAQLTAHRACLGVEHDPSNGKMHGCCVVCGMPFPCDVAKEK